MAYTSVNLRAYFFLLLVLIETGCSSKKLSREELIELKLDSLRKELSEIKQKKIEIILDRLHEKNLLNGSVLVAEYGKILFQKNYGYADFRTQRKLDSQSVFQIGVLSQQFTAMLIMMLAEQKKLNYEDPVYYYVKKWPYKNTTIHQLLTHTSGLPDYISYFYTNSEDLMTYATNRNVMDWITLQKPALNFQPGKSWEFSHTNYVILVEVIEYITRQKYPNVLQEKILHPLDMKHTSLYTKLPAKPKEIKRVYGFKPDNQSLYDDNFLNKIYGDRGLFSSIEDLYRWDQALYEGTLLSQSALQKAFQPVKLPNESHFPYGFGWYLDGSEGSVYHMSGWLGFQCMLMRMPLEKNTIILMTNNSNPVFGEIRDMLVNILYNRPYRVPG